MFCIKIPDYQAPSWVKLSSYYINCTKTKFMTLLIDRPIKINQLGLLEHDIVIRCYLWPKFDWSEIMPEFFNQFTKIIQLLQKNIREVFFVSNLHPCCSLTPSEVNKLEILSCSLLLQDI